MDNINFDIPPELLDEIQQNIESIIEGFDIPTENKVDVIKKINFMYTRTKQLSITDALTNLYNRRYFEISLEREYIRVQRYNSDLSMAVIDIDFFKSINDTYGHSCGDFVLKKIGHMLLQGFRQTDLLFRFGGEEFIVLMPETNLENAFIPIERFRKLVEDTEFIFKDQIINVSISGGIASNKTVEDMWQMFDNADKALYDAKNLGRNKVIKMVGR